VTERKRKAEKRKDKERQREAKRGKERQREAKRNKEKQRDRENRRIFFSSACSNQVYDYLP
jgi:hypothetical protein